MKHILISALIFFIFGGCGGKKDTPENKNISLAADTTDLKTQTTTDISEAILSYNLEKGKTYKYKLTTIADEVQSIEADTIIKQDLKQTITYLLSLNVKDVDVDGIMEIEFVYDKIKINALANGKPFNYESGTKMDSVEKIRYLDYEAMINNPFIARINKSGEVVEIYRVDKIINKMIELKNLKDKIQNDEKQVLQGDVTNIVIRPLLAQIFRKFPDKKVSKDSTWAFPQQPANLQVFTLESTHTFKLKSFDKYKDENIAFIEGGIEAKYTISPEAKKNNIEVKKPNFTAEGKIYFNLSKSILQKSKTRTSINVELSMVAPTPKGMQKVTRKQSTVNTNIVELL